MDNGLASLVQAAYGNGAPTDPNSRYHGSDVQALQPDAGGPAAVYLAPRLLPQPALYRQVQSYTVRLGDRLDLIAARFLGDPALFWMICDANLCFHPDELTATPGRVLRIPAVSGLPSGGLHG